MRKIIRYAELFSRMFLFGFILALAFEHICVIGTLKIREFIKESGVNV